MSTGRGIAVANIESVKHGIEKDSWIVARGVRTTSKSSSGNRVMHECFVFGPDQAPRGAQVQNLGSLVE